MEAHRSTGGRIKRKPLADCTNVISRPSQQSSSSLVKNVFKRIFDQTSLKEKPKDVNTSVAASSGTASRPLTASRSVSTNVRSVTRRRVSTDLGSPASASSRPQTSSSVLGASDKESRRIVDQNTLKEKTKDVNTSVAATSGTASRSLTASRPISTNVRPVTRSRVSTDLGSPASAPSRPQTSGSGLGASDKESRRIVDQNTFKEKPKDVNTSVAAASGTASQAVSTNIRPVTRSRVSTYLGSPSSAPSRPQTSSSDWGVSDKEISEPWSVYTRKRKRNKDTSSSRRASRLHLDLTSSSGKKTQKADINKTKPSKEPPKKRQRTVKQEKQNSVLGAPQDDYIEKQKAFFDELDASELPVEEVSNSDSD